MKPTIIGLLLACGVMAARAQATDFLTLRTADGAEHSLAADGLKITFANGHLLARNATATLDLPLNALDLMFLSDKPTGIAATGRESLRAEIRNGSLRVEAPAGSTVSLYTTAGLLLGKYVKSAPGGEILCGNLPAGIYIVSINGKTYKIAAR